ncbi:MAG: class I SAM-dependent methyltransferase [Solirubrobacterales bacterium]|nr:class I SAM-dependent methyltransferase [Solirubrobacterales bacterium]
MDQRLMKAMLDLDEHHWWYRGRRLIVGSELGRLKLPSDAEILDAGCGSGRTLVDLAHHGTVSGIELDPDAAEFAASRGCGEVKVGRLEELPWPDRTFHLITCLDVLEHTPDDRRALSELRRVTTFGGWLLLTVPAYQALWSLHDAANHHFRRYSRRSLRLAALEAGWRLVRLTSFNTILLPVAAAVRLAQRQRSPDSSYNPELKLGPAWLNSALEQPLRAEARWLDRGGTLPAGLSLLAVLENPSPRVDGGAPEP